MGAVRNATGSFLICSLLQQGAAVHDVSWSCQAMLHRRFFKSLCCRTTEQSVVDDGLQFSDLTWLTRTVDGWDGLC
ncbi:hypothetical protein IE81DRAFT_327032 [Ceraceosorus guamensis]|uniref:Secreted protein n=1 Tax=Ceraceosorus guamensis TaxID=1522189 RepID=A0A316VR86_9BASI|nr:hypothetical protein IE81DRAFT_327032 [Ceraceosorus guamensis]PWN38913.1 hypothetical protein IE81DRAFT_327032 [Ceraceosorus guamensis]